MQGPFVHFILNITVDELHAPCLEYYTKRSCFDRQTKNKGNLNIGWRDMAHTNTHTQFQKKDKNIYIMARNCHGIRNAQVFLASPITYVIQLNVIYMQFTFIKLDCWLDERQK